jgi:hypothetical protein
MQSLPVIVAMLPKLARTKQVMCTSVIVSHASSDAVHHNLSDMSLADDLLVSQSSYESILVDATSFDPIGLPADSNCTIDQAEKYLLVFHRRRKYGRSGYYTKQRLPQTDKQVTCTAIVLRTTMPNTFQSFACSYLLTQSAWKTFTPRPVLNNTIRSLPVIDAMLPYFALTKQAICTSIILRPASNDTIELLKLDLSALPDDLLVCQSSFESKPVHLVEVVVSEPNALIIDQDEPMLLVFCRLRKFGRAGYYKKLPQKQLSSKQNCFRETIPIDHILVMDKNPFQRSQCGDGYAAVEKR